MITIGYLMKQKVSKLDITQMNAIAKCVEKGLQEGNSVSDIENTKIEKSNYDFKIILCNNPEYDKTIYKGLADRTTIMDIKSGDTMIGKILFPLDTMAEEALRNHLLRMSTILFGSLLLFIWGLGAFVYIRFVKPFISLKSFATRIAAGNLDFPLHMQKKNYFGAFTESFDIMREELKASRLGEYEANKSKKELVASLSHDIKTPVSTIKAYCELITVKSNEEDTIRKVQIIDEKADMIDHLISDMFHATLEDLTVLKIICKEEMSTILDEILEQMNHYSKIHKINPIPECLIYCDALRLSQVIDNIINNSYKYAGSKIEVSSKVEQEYLKITIRDFGEEVEESDLPMLCEKFYRGKNSSKTNGSGLGLYLAKQFMEGMKGSLEVYCEQGFVVTLYLRLGGLGAKDLRNR
ncbi:histidine kinase [Lachnoclostridium phytofermentans ISDg]|uniref:histidine kinase n=2 Tax=Lachnoclostridium phytofermentans TaxID=66219 RepID=A9KM62_LACP7|nr:histidine kinase [Lachnoclostridium phytofermentans ISDg]